MDAILGQIKSLIVMLHAKREWNRDFSQMTPDSRLKDFGIYQQKERGWWFDKFGQYIDVTDLNKAITEEFGLREFVDLRRQYSKWQTVNDVAVYVRQSLERTQKEERRRQEYRERTRQEQEARANAEGKAGERGDAGRGQQEEGERKRQEHERRSRASKKGWARRREREQRERRDREQRTREERSHRNQNEGRNEENLGRDNPSLRTYCLRILDLPLTASEEDIKSKYRELAKRAHPDHGGDAHHFRIIKDAYDRLIGRVGR